MDGKRIRAFYANATAWSFDGDAEPHIVAARERQSAEFDAWLGQVRAAARREGQAEALREAARSMRSHKSPGHWNLRDEIDPVNAGQSPDAWLERRADRIENGADL